LWRKDPGLREVRDPFSASRFVESFNFPMQMRVEAVNQQAIIANFMKFAMTPPSVRFMGRSKGESARIGAMDP
jgi:hypothetical protein